MGEGRGPRPSETLRDQMDAKLDVVAWKDFADGRPGKLILFGQCATGDDWRDKIGELPATAKWCDSWLVRVPVVDPLRVFFVPHRIPAKRWDHANRYGGVFFDRCRIAQLSGGLAADALAECRAWSAHVIANRLLTP